MTSWESTRCSSTFKVRFTQKLTERQPTQGTRGGGGRIDRERERERVNDERRKRWYKDEGKRVGRGGRDLITIAAFVTPSRTSCTFVFPVSPHFISLNRGAQRPPFASFSLSTREDNYVFQGNGSNSVPGTRERRRKEPDRRGCGKGF